jgi:hypothetical protein
VQKYAKYPNKDSSFGERFADFYVDTVILLPHHVGVTTVAARKKTGAERCESVFDAHTLAKNGRWYYSTPLWRVKVR